MPKYMIITKTGEGKASASFYETYEDAYYMYKEFEYYRLEPELYHRGVFEKDCLEEYRLLFC